MEISEPDWFTRYNFRPEGHFEAVERLLDGEEEPSVLLPLRRSGEWVAVLGGGGGVRRLRLGHGLDAS